MINLFNVVITTKSKKYINEVLDSRMLNEGEYVRRFEEGFKETFRIKNAIALNSCTSALHLSLLCAGVKRDDEVILPAQTFIATGTSILMAGAKPIFVDIDPNTGNINPSEVRTKITEKTKAIIAVDWGGIPCNIKSIMDISNDIPIIEDAAHALGASINDMPVGEMANFTCFSFQAIKFLTTGDGGMLCSKYKCDLDKAKEIKWFGYNQEKLKKHFEGDRDYKVTELGFKYNMNNISAALGLGNLEEILTRLSIRRNIANRYVHDFSNLRGIKLLNIPNEYHPSYWIFTMLVEDRENFIKKMRSNDIEVSVLDRRIDIHPVFGGMVNLPGQEVFDKEQISIPCHEGLDSKDVDKIIKTIREGW